MDYTKFRRVLTGSKRYEMDCEGHLIITDYFTGEQVVLDLTLISEEVFEEIKTEEEEI